MSIFGTGAGNLGNPKRTREQTVTCIAQTEVSTKTQNPTCNPEEGWEKNNYPEQKSESVPSHMLRCRGSCTWGSVGRLASSLRRPTCPFQGPTLKSGDPSKEERSGHKGPFQRGQGWATSGGDRRVGEGAGVGGAAAGSSISPP